ERKLGKIIQDTTNSPVNLSNPEKTIDITIAEWNAFVSIERIPGFGGLPEGVEGKVICIMKDDIGSKVSEWMMKKRGCKTIRFENTDKINELIEETGAKGVAAGLTIEDLEKITELKKNIKVPLFFPVIGLSKEKISEIYESIL
ncbi:MAG: hypothetical protein JXA43_01515, partial [Candidatus Diapherotrites archaeon]|nr:hypothetical protein [Candidatus Diapherotrites archaeon]